MLAAFPSSLKRATARNDPLRLRFPAVFFRFRALARHRHTPTAPTGSASSGGNPKTRTFAEVLIDWAAEGLDSVDQIEEARALADEERALARRWGDPHAIGASLRVLGLIEGSEAGIAPPLKTGSATPSIR